MVYLRIHLNGFSHIWRTVYNNAQLVGPYLTAVYLTCGVPQGTILGPLLFFLLICLSTGAQTLFVIYIRDSIALRFEPFKRMYENGSKIALNSTCSKGFK